MLRLVVVIVLAILFSACTSSMQPALPPDAIPPSEMVGQQQVETLVEGGLTQTATAPTPPGSGEANSGNVGPFALTFHQSPTLGIQFYYPVAWYRQETPSGVEIASFDLADPPHKLTGTEQMVRMQFSYMVLLTPPASFDAWVESAKQTALAEGLSLFAEERFTMSNQPATRLSLVSGSGGIIHRVLTSLSGRYLVIDVEGDYDLAKPVLDSVQPLALGGVKPPDSDTPTSGICQDAVGDPAVIVLGSDASGLPLAGRCVMVTPEQRIKFVNQSTETVHMFLGEYHLEIPVGGDAMIEKPAGQYLALGVHIVPMGPELWVKNGVVATAPPPIVEYNNSTLGYRLALPGDWLIDENGMTNSTNQEVIFSPPNAEPFVAYLSVSLEVRALDQVMSSYAQYFPDAIREDTVLNGYPALIYSFPGGRNDYFIPQGNQLFLISTDRPNEDLVRSILMTFQFTATP